jgi:hypothetical protein
MKARLTTPPRSGTAQPQKGLAFASSAAAARCRTRSAEASARGDHLEAQYWLSSAATADRRAAATRPAPPSLFQRLFGGAGLFSGRLERVA